MEPSEIDRIIKEKLSGSNDLHNHELDAAKPFIWSAVYNEVNQKRSLRWYHLAAAVVILMISFSVVIYSIQTSHEREIDQLSEKVSLMEKKYSSQMEILQAKNVRIDSLGNELRNVALKFTSMPQANSVMQREKVVYRTDTVYVKQIKYMVDTSGSEESNESDKIKGEPIFAEASKEDNMETNYAIYSDNFNQRNTQQSESFKLKFGSFATKNN